MVAGRRRGKVGGCEGHSRIHGLELFELLEIASGITCCGCTRMIGWSDRRKFATYSTRAATHGRHSTIDIVLNLPAVEKANVSPVSHVPNATIMQPFRLQMPISCEQRHRRRPHGDFPRCYLRNGRQIELVQPIMPKVPYSGYYLPTIPSDLFRRRSTIVNSMQIMSSHFVATEKPVRSLRGANSVLNYRVILRFVSQRRN